jgi:hypothetical protein
MKASFYNNWLRAVLILLLAMPMNTLAQVKEWDRTFGGDQGEVISSLQQTSDGGYILGGTSYSGVGGDKTEISRGEGDYWVVKLDSTGKKEWDRTIGGNQRDILTSLQQTNDGGYILGGYSDSGISGDKTQDRYGDYEDNLDCCIDYWIVKLDANGNKQWDRTYGGDGYDLLRSLLQTSDGGYILGGDSNSPSSGDKSEGSRGAQGSWVVKIDSEGNKEWDRSFGRDSDEEWNSIQQTSDGGYIVGGYYYNFVGGGSPDYPQGGDNYWIVKLDSGGNKEWERQYGGEENDRLYSLQQTSDGGYILGGWSESGISGEKTEASRGGIDYWIVKVDSVGNKEWDRTYGGDGWDRLSSIQLTNDGGYILGGWSESGISGDKSQASRGNIDFWIVRLDSTGNKKWDRTFGGEAEDRLYSLQQTTDGGYILGGGSDSGISGDKSEASRGDWDYWVVKLYGEPCTPPTPAITLIPSSDVYTGGDPATLYLGYGPQSVRLVASGGESYTWSPATDLSSTATAETVFTPTAAGTYTFTVTAYSGVCPATASVTIKVVDARCGTRGKVRVCHNGRILCLAPSAVKAHLRHHKNDRLGICGEAPDSEDMLTITIPLKVFPNPFGGWANVEFSLPVAGDYRLELYSANGKMLGVVAQGQGKEGQLVRLELKGEQLREGIYYLKLITQDEVQTARLVLKK